LNDHLANIGERRIQDLEKGKVSLHILSHAPGDFTRAECTLGNDELAVAIRKNPHRLAGFAMLPISDSVAASQELERCVKDLGFAGALVETMYTACSSMMNVSGASSKRQSS
jgi:predicted TIM-barrel fold metal-dependent hydrolase